MAWVWNQSDARGLDRLVLLSIADHADEFGGSAWPSLGRIAERCGISRSSAIRCVSRLEELGELEVIDGGGAQGQGGTTNAYRITALWAESTAGSGVTGPPLASRKWSPRGTSSGEELVPTGTEVVSARHRSGPPLTPEPSRTVRTAGSAGSGARQTPPDPMRRPALKEFTGHPEPERPADSLAEVRKINRARREGTAS